MQENYLLVLIFGAVVLLMSILYIIWRYTKKNKIIQYAQHIEILEDLQWEYDRKLGAYKFFMKSTLLTFLLTSISIYLYISLSSIIIFHLLTIMSIIYTIYYNYLNRDALLNKIEVKE